MLAELQADMAAWVSSMAHKTIDDYTATDVKMALAHHNITFDVSLADKNAIDGPKFNKIKTERVSQSWLGISTVGDCSRVVKLVRDVRANKALPGVVNIDVDGKMTSPSTWSVVQFYEWASQGPLNAIADKLKQHRFAGDIITNVGLETVIALLDLNADTEETVFIDEMTSLREKMSSDAVPGILSLIFVICHLFKDHRMNHYHYLLFFRKLHAKPVVP